MAADATAEQLAARLEKAEAMLHALGGQEADAILGNDGVMLVRTHDWLEKERLAQEAARASEALYQAILRALPAHIAVVNRQGEIVAVNQAWHDFAAIGPAESALTVAVGSNYLDVCRRAVAAHDELAVAALAGIEGVLHGTRRDFTMEYPCHTPQAQHWFLMTVVPLDAAGDGGLVISHLDITDRKQAEAELRAAKGEAERANNAKSRFLAAASHDLRQPLSALSIYVSSLKTQVMPAGQGMLGSMKQCIGGLSELLTDLLDLSKLEAGVVVPDVSDFPIANLLARLESVYAPEAQLRKLQLRFAHSSWTVRTDPILFQRALGNLIDNALCYANGGGVLVACRRRQGKTWVEVWDNGIGIAADKTTEIFEEFKQLGDGARNSGSGLGLAIVAKTAALLGIEINVRSWPGKGSVFAIELPRGQSAPAVPGAPTRAAGRRRSLRIALVDDNPLVCQALAEGLHGLGHQVVAAASGTALLAELGTLAPDLVLSDYRLAQGETGFDVIMAVRARLGAELPAILITGDTDPTLLRSMTDRGMVVLHKPLDLETLQALFEDLAPESA